MRLARVAVYGSDEKKPDANEMVTGLVDLGWEEVIWSERGEWMGRDCGGEFFERVGVTHWFRPPPVPEGD